MSKSIGLILVCLLLVMGQSFATVFVASSSGSWALGITWGNPGDDTEGSGFPGPGDVARIAENIVVTVPSGFAASCATLVINYNAVHSNTLVNLQDNTASLTTTSDIRLMGASTSTGAGSKFASLSLNGATVTVGGDLVMMSWSDGADHQKPIVNLQGGTLDISGGIQTSASHASALITMNFSGDDASTLIFGGVFNSIGAFTAGVFNNGGGTIGNVVIDSETADLAIPNTFDGATITYRDLTLSSTAAVSKIMAGDFTVNGTLSLEGGTIFDDGGHTLTYGASAKARYAGAAAQNTGDEFLASGLKTLVVDNALGVTMKNSASINTLIMTSGLLDMGSYTLTINDGYKLDETCCSSTSYVYSSSDNGYINNKVYSAGSPHFFPVGTSTYYNPVSIQNTNAADDGSEFGVLVLSDPSNMPYDTTRIIHSEWNISASISPANDMYMKFEWQAAQEAGNWAANEGSGVVLGHWNGVDYDQHAMSNLVGNSIEILDYAYGYSPFILGAGISPILPIELSAFTGEKHSNGVLLNWQTSSEINSKVFYVEKSTDNESFSAFTKMDAAGNSSTTLHYKAVDENPHNGMNYYRLKEVDLDGTIQYSHSMAVPFNAGIDALLFPNPVNDGILNVDLNERYKEVGYEVYDGFGRLLKRQTFNSGGALQIETAFMQPGMYNLLLHLDGHTYREAFVVE